MNFTEVQSESEMEISRVVEQERETEMITRYIPVFILSLSVL